MDFPPDNVKETVRQIAELLRNKNHTLGISEAACGGLLSAYVVSIANASNFYIGGKSVYSLRQRLRLSGWSNEEISTYMGPSENVAVRLARTTRYELGSTYLLSETGFAGPSNNLNLGDGSSESVSSVGTVYLGLSGPNGEVSCTRNTDSSDRSHNMTEFARLGLEFLLQELQKNPEQ